jgi:GNAT superfamily N-acetyltransferase
MEWRIRDATASDAASVAQVHVAAWRAAYGGMVPQAYLDALDPAERALAWPAILDAVDVALVAHTDAAVVGFATGGRSRDADAAAAVGEVGAIYVSRDRWRRGIGRILLEACIQRLSQRGYREATLWVLEANHGSRAFYERLGWLPDGCRQEYPLGSETRPVVRYRRSLDSASPGA